MTSWMIYLWTRLNYINGFFILLFVEALQEFEGK